MSQIVFNRPGDASRARAHDAGRIAIVDDLHRLPRPRRQ